MRSENIEHPLAIANAAAGGYLHSKDGLLTVVMLRRVVVEDAFFVRLADRPTRKAAGDLLHVLLCVAAIDAKRVKLHQLASIVFVDAPGVSFRFVLGRRICVKNARVP